MRVFGTQKALELGTFNGLVPADGPKSLPITIDFSVDPVWKVDLTQQTNLKIVNFIQCVFVDNSQNTEPLYIQTETVRQQIVIPPFSQGYVPILAARPPVLNMQTAGGIAITFHFLNVPMPLAIWSVTSPPAYQFDGNGYLQVDSPALSALVQDPDGSGNGMAVHVLSGGGGGGSGLRLPANYGAVRGQFQTAVTSNLITASPRFYINAISLSLDPLAYRSAGTDGIVTFTIYQGTSEKWVRKVWLPGAIPTPGPTTVEPVQLLELTNLDYWSTVDSENLRVGLNAALGGSAALQVTVMGGAGSPP